MTYLNFQIGDTIPVTPKPEPRGAQRGTMPGGPVWYALHVLSGAESAVGGDLRVLGVDDAWHPTKAVRRHIHRGPRKGQVVETIRAAVSGYTLFRVTGWPQWDLILAVKDVVGALGGVQPRQISEADISKMAQMPERLAQIIEEERRKHMIDVGDTVEIIAGALAGNSFVVGKIEDGYMVGDFAFFGAMMPVRVHAEFVRKVVGE